MEPHSSEVMNEKPRSADKSILTKDFLGKIIMEGFVIGAMTMLLVFDRLSHERCTSRQHICFLVHFVWHAYFMDLTVSQITRLSLQNASLTTSGCREHLYLARCLLPLY